jgi:hypothetical protein
MYARSLAGIFIGSLLTQPTPAIGQDKGNSKPVDSQTVTMWVSELATANPDVWEELGKFSSYQEALDCSTKWSKAHPMSNRLTREREIKVRITPSRPGTTVQPLQVSPSAVKPGIGIVKPDLKSADPGAKKTTGANVPSLAGKQGTGAIGTSKVTIEFTGESEKGEFTVSGELQGRGNWVQLGPFVQMETGLAKFEGKLYGNKIIGSRTIKASGSKDDWNIDIVKKGTNPRKGQERLEDTKWSPDFATWWIYHLNSQGKFETKDERTGALINSGTWEQQGNKVLLKLDSSFIVIELVRNEDKMTGYSYSSNPEGLARDGKSRVEFNLRSTK